MNNAFALEDFPRSSKYHPEWIRASVSGGANPLWLTEWLARGLNLQPNMRVLDLGCGRAMSSIFLHKEFGVQVWAADLLFSVSENYQRIRDADVENDVFPIQADARFLPFATEFFDVIISIDSFFYYGTDDLYLNSLARFLKPGGQLGIAGAGLIQEFQQSVPEHLRQWWTQDLWCLHSAGWWQQHWQRTGIVEIEVADTLSDGWQLWQQWHKAIAPDNRVELEALQADGGRYLGYVRVIGRKQKDIQSEEPLLSIPTEYTRRPLLLNQD
jgi:cyclopropane fatty-acyl-phospholipid synthase-like methyltransferase